MPTDQQRFEISRADGDKVSALVGEGRWEDARALWQRSVKPVAAASPTAEAEGPSPEMIRVGAEAIKRWDEQQPKNAGARAVQRSEMAEAVLSAVAAYPVREDK